MTLYIYIYLKMAVKSKKRRRKKVEDYTLKGLKGENKIKEVFVSI